MLEYAILIELDGQKVAFQRYYFLRLAKGDVRLEGLNPLWGIPKKQCNYFLLRYFPFVR
jgi:hypothetical protein